MNHRPQLALLVGIDHYRPRPPAHLAFPDLGGCCRDVATVAAMLRAERAGAPRRIIELTSPNDDSQAPLPTYENIIRSWRALLAQAHPGDQLLVHFSGHGSRVPSWTPGKEVDEALVPCNVGNPEARYLRDVEVLYLLEETLRHDVHPTLVLDSCHAGGMAHRGRARSRGTGLIDPSPRPSDSLVASRAQLDRAWRAAAGRRQRKTELASGWLPAPRGYVLLAACRAHEKAFESIFGGRQGGVLTQRWLTTWQQQPQGTWQQLYPALQHTIAETMEGQLPIVEGEVDRQVFTNDTRRPDSGSALILEQQGDRVLLQAGYAHGAEVGSRFALSDKQPDGKTEIEIEEVGSVLSWGRMAPGRGEQQIPVGSHARALSPPPTERPTVSLAPALAQHLAFFEIALVDLATLTLDPPSKADIRIEPCGDRIAVRFAGQAVADSGDPREVVDWVRHLAFFDRVRRLQNSAPGPGLAQSLAASLRRPTDPTSGRPVQRLETGCEERFYLELHNRAEMAINLAILNLDSAFAIERIYPRRSEGPFFSLEAGARASLPFETTGPAGRELLKVIAALQGIDLTPLERPPLNALVRRSGAEPEAEQPERLLTRTAGDWISLNFEVIAK
ncbi:MAG: caspase family protein [Acidobacteriota bacterium]